MSKVFIDTGFINEIYNLYGDESLDLLRKYYGTDATIVIPYAVLEELDRSRIPPGFVVTWLEAQEEKYPGKVESPKVSLETMNKSGSVAKSLESCVKLVLLTKEAFHERL